MRVFRKLLALACTAALFSPEAAAAPFNSATLRRIIDGREVFIDRRQASVNETADRGQELSTGSSRAEVLFDRRALGFLGNNTLIRLGEDCFRLDQGQVLINGPQNSCLGTKVLGVRGTTYVLSVQDDETYELAVLSGTATVGDAMEEPAINDRADILSMYPTLNPLIGLGSSAWSSTASGDRSEPAAGLILGDASFFLPLNQSMGSNLLYSYTTASSNFDRAWGASTELGYKWFNPDNRSINSLMVGYDGWDVAGCFHSQVAVGGLWQRGRWQFGVTGGIPLDQCDNNLGFAIGQVGIPVADVGEQSITLSVSPYLLHGIGQSFGGGRIGLNVPVGNQLTLSAYGQYDNLLDTVIGGQISYRFSTGRGFVDDPNLPGQSSESPLPWQAGQRKDAKPIQIALNEAGDDRPTRTQSTSLGTQPSDNKNLISDSDSVISLKAGEQARFDRDGRLLNRQTMSKERFSQLIIETMKGQNLLPESHAISLVYQQLYGLPNRILLAILGSDWMIGARTPFPRLRGANNLVVPDNKLPKKQDNNQEAEKTSEEEAKDQVEDDSGQESNNNGGDNNTATNDSSGGNTSGNTTTDNNNTGSDINPEGASNTGGNINPDGDINTGDSKTSEGNMNPGTTINPGSETDNGGSNTSEGNINPSTTINPGGDINTSGSNTNGGKINPSTTITPEGVINPGITVNPGITINTGSVINPGITITPGGFVNVVGLDL